LRATQDGVSATSAFADERTLKHEWHRVKKYPTARVELFGGTLLAQADRGRLIDFGRWLVDADPAWKRRTHLYMSERIVGRGCQGGTRYQFIPGE
jgi:hypothetical protein